MPHRLVLLLAALAAAGCGSPEAAARPCLSDRTFVRALERSLAGREQTRVTVGAPYPIRLVGDTAICRQALAGIGAGSPGPREAGYVFQLPLPSTTGKAQVLYSSIGAAHWSV